MQISLLLRNGKSSEHMKIIGDNDHTVLRFIQQFSAVDQILCRIRGSIFRKYPLRIDSCIRKISFHTLRFADRLVITLSAGHDDLRLRIGIQVFYGFIQTFLQYIAGTGSLPLSSQYDDVVRSRLCFRAKLPEDHSF